MTSGYPHEPEPIKVTDITGAEIKADAIQADVIGGTIPSDALVANALVANSLSTNMSLSPSKQRLMEQVLESIAIHVENDELFIECNYCSKGDYLFSHSATQGSWTKAAADHLFEFHPGAVR